MIQTTEDFIVIRLNKGEAFELAQEIYFCLDNLRHGTEGQEEQANTSYNIMELEKALKQGLKKYGITA